MLKITMHKLLDMNNMNTGVSSGVSAAKGHAIQNDFIGTIMEDKRKEEEKKIALLKAKKEEKIALFKIGLEGTNNRILELVDKINSFPAGSKERGDAVVQKANLLSIKERAELFLANSASGQLH